MTFESLIAKPNWGSTFLGVEFRVMLIGLEEIVKAKTVKRRLPFIFDTMEFWVEGFEAAPDGILIFDPTHALHENALYRWSIRPRPSFSGG